MKKVLTHKILSVYTTGDESSENWVELIDYLDQGYQIVSQVPVDRAIRFILLSPIDPLSDNKE